MIQDDALTHNTTRVMPLPIIDAIVSGGQTGVDRAALDVALQLRIPCGGWCPKGRTAEDGAIPLHYPLSETPSPDYPQRTEWNVRDSDGTLLLTWGAPMGGTALTIGVARRLGKPFLMCDLKRPFDAGSVRSWMAAHGVRVLNIAGPRESSRPGIYTQARQLLSTLLSQ